MHIRIQILFCCAILLGFASAAQNAQKSSSGFDFKDEDAAIEGSGYNGEVTHDLESSGSGYGPTDDDDEDGVKPPDEQNPVSNIPTERKINDPLDTSFVEKVPDTTEDTSVIMNPKSEDRPTSFFAQPGILAAVIGGAVVGLLCAILVVMFIVYRMRKKDEGSYALGEPKTSPNSNSYSRGTNKEFFA